MGLFSSKKKYFAYAASQGLFDDDTRPDTFKSQLIQSAGQDHRSMADAVNLTINTDQFARAKSMFRYAKRYGDPAKSGGYIRGLPTSSLNQVLVAPEAVEQALGRAVGSYDSILSQISGVYDERFFVNRAIQLAWVGHWDETQINITVPGTAISTLNDPDFVRRGDPDLDPDDFLEVMGPDRFVRRTLYADYDGMYTVEWDYEDGGTQYYTMQVDISSYLSGNYVMVKYYIGAELKYWVYEIGSGADPIFESAIEESAGEAEFLPVAVLMQDKVWFDEDAAGNPTPDTELAITTNRLLKRLATSGTEIKEDFLLQEAEDDASGDGNKSNAKKWDFFVHFAVPIHTKVRGSLEYLWNFFQGLEGWSAHTWDEYFDYLASQGVSGYSKAQPINELTIKEAGDHGYNVSYRWSFIHTKTFAGDYIIPDLDHEDGERPLKPKEVVSAIWERTDDGQDPMYQEDLDDMFGPGTITGLDGDDAEETGYHDYVILTRGLEDGTGYERMLIMGLSMEYKINTKDTEHSTGKKGYNFRYAQPQLFGTDEETKEFRIPLQWGPLKEVATMHREEAVGDGLCATLFLVEVQKVKWYQTGFFKWLLIIIAIVLIVLAIWFPELIQVAAWAITAALGGSQLLFYFVMVVLIFSVGYMISIGMSLMSPELQLALAIVLVVAMLYTGQLANIKSAWSQFQTSPGWATAGSFLSTINPIYNMGFQVYSYTEMQDLEAEYEQLLETKEEQMQQLQDYADMIGPGPSWLDPMDLVIMYKRDGDAEMADSYYTRTLNANPGLLGFEMVNSFADLALTLPKPGQKTIVEGLFEDLEEQRRQ